MNREIIFIIEEDPEGGYCATALGESIVTQAETREELRKNIVDAVRCHFEEESCPQIVRLHFVSDEVLAV